MVFIIAEHGHTLPPPVYEQYEEPQIVVDAPNQSLFHISEQPYIKPQNVGFL